MKQGEKKKFKHAGGKKKRKITSKHDQDAQTKVTYTGHILQHQHRL